MASYYIKTYGCQMNKADSAKLASVLESAGYQAGNQTADIILVNTCVVRQNAEDRAAWFIQSLKGQKKKNSNLKIGVCGCLVTEPGKNPKDIFPHVDFFIPPNNSDKLAEYLHLTFDIGHLSLSKQKQADTKFVSIMHGCDNFCSYCIVPYVRGREISRPLDEVLAEIKGLIEQDITDITLLGQNVNSYKYGLANLLREIAKNRKLKAESRISFLTSHPKDLSDEIIETVAGFPYVAKDFLLPLQSGDDEILKKMNRGYTLEYYINRVNKIRYLMPQARISTDIMVGSPGETEEQFQNTLRATQSIAFNDVHMFAYSDRPGTIASKMPGQLQEAVKQERLQRLIKIVRGMTAKNK